LFRSVSGKSHQLQSAVGADGRIWGSWWCFPCDNDLFAWHPGTFSTRKFKPGTQIATLSRDPYFEELYIVDDQGMVWRAWWSASLGWTHLRSYDPFGRFSSLGKLPAGATIAVNARNINGANLLAVNAAGDILSEWWDGSMWMSTKVYWEDTVTSAWDIWPFGHTPANSLPAMIANVGVDNAPRDLLDPTAQQQHPNVVLDGAHRGFAVRRWNLENAHSHRHSLTTVQTRPGRHRSLPSARVHSSLFEDMLDP